MSDRCPSCGEEYANHLGLIGTCYRLQEAIGVVGELETKIDRLTAELAEAREATDNYWYDRYRCVVDRAEQAEKKLIQAEKEISAWREINIQAARTVEQAERERDRYEQGVEAEGMLMFNDILQKSIITLARNTEYPMYLEGQRVRVLVMKNSREALKEGRDA